MTDIEYQEQSEEDAVTAQEQSPPMSRWKRLLWTLLFILIAAASIFAVVSQNRSFSMRTFLDYIAHANPAWLVAAVLSMLTFITMEGFALLCICKTLGAKCLWRNSFSYSAADIYFSAITPSATGGQPASAFLMMRDGLSGAQVTVSLLTNLIMYTLSILTIGVFTFAVRPGMFLTFDTPGRILIVVGCVAQVGLALIFILLLRQGKILHWICDKGLLLLSKIHLVRNVDRKREKLCKSMQEFKYCSTAMHGHWRALAVCFLLNLLQRAAQISVTMFTFLATGGAPSGALDVWMVQSYTVIGSNCIPIPGAMGVSDYLLINGLGKMMSAEETTHLELLSRTLSFYICILICGLTFLLKCVLQNRRKKRI